MKRLLLVLPILMFSISAIAQQGAKIVFEATDNTIDYGKISKNSDSGIRVLTFTNTGDAPLIIQSIIATTGVTILSSHTTPVAPGKKDQIQIKHNLSPGLIRKTITIESNAVNYEDGRTPLKIKGEVILN